MLAGLAISVLPECALRPGMRVLTEEEGFPRLKDAEIAVMRGKNTATPVISALIEHIRESLRNMVPPTEETPLTRQLPETRVIRSQRLRPGMTAAEITARSQSWPGR